MSHEKPRPSTHARLRLQTAALLCALALLAAPAWAAETPPDFQTWLDALRAEALGRGISPGTLDAALGGVQTLPEVIVLDQAQPEFEDSFLDYLDRRLTPQLVADGRRLLRQHARLLAKLQGRYGIPPSILVALWGMESGYGTNLGRFPVPAALTTLAYDPRRGAFFREQLLAALAILEAGHVRAADMKGSWAGAMGQMQFMPSTFLAHAVDADGDGRKDLWHSLPDALSSAANYLHRLGWRKTETWGREVRLPADFDWQLSGPDIEKPLSEWSALGVRQADGSPLPAARMSGAILLPQGHRGPAFLVYRNFQSMLAWNRSVRYALAVGLLADNLRGLPGLRNGRDAERMRLSRAETTQMQLRLASLGFDPGEADGVIGYQTRSAIRRFQKAAGMPADGYPSPALLDRLQAFTAPPAQPPEGEQGPAEAPSSVSSAQPAAARQPL